MASPIWKGHISFGLVNIPVGLYSAESRDSLDFDLIDRRDGARVRYRRVNEETGEKVPWSEVAKGHQQPDGEYVLLDPEELKQADPEAAETVRILDFVEAGAIGPTYFDKPYYLAPEKSGRKGYVLLREAMRETGMVGVAKVVIRQREHLAALLPGERVLVLNLLRFAHELRDPAEELALPAEEPEEHGITKKEMKSAVRLIKDMAAEWDPAAYRDEYRRKVLEWIEAKAEEGETAAPPAGEGPEGQQAGKVVDMSELLEKSRQRRRKQGGKSSGGSKSKKKKSSGS
jgi:DNA end-binding protein Ku